MEGNIILEGNYFRRETIQYFGTKLISEGKYFLEGNSNSKFKHQELQRSQGGRGATTTAPPAMEGDRPWRQLEGDRPQR